MYKQVLVTCNGQESYAAIVKTPNGEVSVHANDNGEIVVYLLDEQTTQKMRIVDGRGNDRFFPEARN